MTKSTPRERDSNPTCQCLTAARCFAMASALVGQRVSLAEAVVLVGRPVRGTALAAIQRAARATGLSAQMCHIAIDGAPGQLATSSAAIVAISNRGLPFVVTGRPDDSPEPDAQGASDGRTGLTVEAVIPRAKGPIKAPLHRMQPHWHGTALTFARPSPAPAPDIAALDKLKSLDVLFIGPAPLGCRGDAEVAMSNLLRALKRRGHRVAGVCLKGGHKPGRGRQHPLVLMPALDQEQLNELVMRLRPLTVFTEIQSGQGALHAAQGAGVPLCLFVRSQEARERHEALFREATEIVCSSSGMRDAIWRCCRRRSVVHYPLAGVSEGHEPTPDGPKVYFTSVGHVDSTGADVTNALARRLSDRQFLCVNWGGVRLQDSVIHIGELIDMSPVWEQTHIHLMPASSADGGERACVEAARFGVPTLASRVGGIPEWVGAGGALLDAPHDIDAWLEAIEVIDANYEAFSRAAREHSQRLHDISSIEALLHRHARLRQRSRPLPASRSRAAHTRIPQAAAQAEPVKRRHDRLAGRHRPCVEAEPVIGRTVENSSDNTSLSLIHQPPAVMLSVQMITVNQVAAFRRAVESLLANTQSEFDLHVWTNAAPAQTVRWIEELRTRIPEQAPRVARFMFDESDRNAGFIVPHNRMVGSARGRYLVIVNDDVVFGPNWDVALLDAFESNPRLAAAGPKQLFGRLDSTCTGVPGTGPIEYVEGSCLCVPREIVERHGLFDGHMELFYCEDTDFSLRLRALGYEIAEVLECNVKHLSGLTRKGSPELERLCRRAERHNKAILRERYADYLKSRQFPRHTVVVVRRAAHGDMVDLEPALAGLRERFPWSKIVLKTCCPELMTACPHIDEVQRIGARDRESADRARGRGREPTPSQPEHSRYSSPAECLFDLDDAYERTPGKHHARAFCDAVGTPFRHPQWWLTSQSQAQALTLLPGRGETIAFHVQACWPERTWPIERFQAAAKALAGRYAIVQAGGPADAKLGIGRDLRGVSWDSIAACLARCRLLVAVDSALHHLASAVGTESVVIFGCSRPDVVATPRTHALWNDQLACAGCLQREPPPVRMVKCKRKRIQCLESISVERVLLKIEEVLSGNE